MNYHTLMFCYFKPSFALKKFLFELLKLYHSLCRFASFSNDWESRKAYVAPWTYLAFLEIHSWSYFFMNMAD